MSSPPTGRNLEQALASGPLNPAAGAALADDLLAALERLHTGGAAHGFVRPELIRLLPDGTAALGPAPAPGDDRAADVRAVAEVVCGALGIALHWSPSEPLRESERAAPALAATLRALAQGSLPLDAAGARAALREAAGGLADDEAVAVGRSELAGRSGAARRPTTPPLQHAPTVTLPSEPSPRRRQLMIAGAIAAALVILTGLGVLGWSTANRHPASETAAGRSPLPVTSTSASPPALPTVPPSNGSIKSVVETPQSTCSPGSTCRIEVDIHFTKTTAPQDVSWQFELIDSCTSDATYVDGGTVHALAGWVHVVGDTNVRLPAGHPLAVVAVTTAPSHAASAPLLISTGNC